MPQAISILLLALFFFVMPAQAAQITDHCENAKTTADIMACVKTQHEEAQGKLKEVFDELITSHPKEDEEGLGTLRTTQKDWIVYRDQECDWKKSQAETESLKRVEELSCLTTLTEQRTNILMQALEREQEEIGDSGYSALPRWMNAVTADHPGIFWHYEDHIHADLNCDGEDEEIMVGLDMNLRDIRVEGQESYEAKALIAIASNPATGRPQTNFIKLSIAPNQGDADFCSPHLDLTLVNKEVVSDETCAASVYVRDENCGLMVLQWDETEYRILPKTEN